MTGAGGAADVAAGVAGVVAVGSAWFGAESCTSDAVAVTGSRLRVGSNVVVGGEAAGDAGPTSAARAEVAGGAAAKAGGAGPADFPGFSGLSCTGIRVSSV